jgi:hypothetical protein
MVATDTIVQWIRVAAHAPIASRTTSDEILHLRVDNAISDLILVDGVRARVHGRWLRTADPECYCRVLQHQGLIESMVLTNPCRFRRLLKPSINRYSGLEENKCRSADSEKATWKCRRADSAVWD